MKALLSVLLLLLIVSCQSEKSYYTDSPEINLAKKGNEAYQNQDWETLRSVFADSASVIVNGWWGEEITSDEYISLLQESTSNLIEYSFSDDSFYEMIVNDDGDKWVHAWSLWTGTFNNGNSAKTVVNLGWLFENDKVKVMTVIYNSLPLSEAANPVEEADTTLVN